MTPQEAASDESSDEEILRRLGDLEAELGNFRVLLERYRTMVARTLLQAGEQGEGGAGNE